MPKRGHIAYGQKLHAYELYARNSAHTDNIHKSIESHWGRTLRSGGSVVTISTVANWVKEFKQIPRDIIEQDKAFRLHKLSLYEIPGKINKNHENFGRTPVSFNKLPTEEKQMDVEIEYENRLGFCIHGTSQISNQMCPN